MQSIDECVVNMPTACCSFWKEPVNISSEMEDSVRSFGIIVPLFARRQGEGYQVYLGQERLKVAQKLQYDTVPVIIRDLSDDEIVVIRIEDNLTHRRLDERKPSEVATMIYEYHNKLKKQGMRSDLLREVRELTILAEEGTLCPVGTKYNSGAIVSNKYGISSRTVSRYLRIAVLCKGLQCMVDIGLLSIRAGINLSYLPVRFQEELVEYVLLNNIKISIDKSEIIRKEYQKNNITIDEVKFILERKQVVSGGFPKMKKLYTKYNLWRYGSKELEIMLDLALQQFLN